MNPSGLIALRLLHVLKIHFPGSISLAPCTANLVANAYFSRLFCFLAGAGAGAAVGAGAGAGAGCGADAGAGAGVGAGLGAGAT